MLIVKAFIELIETFPPQGIHSYYTASIHTCLLVISIAKYMT